MPFTDEPSQVTILGYQPQWAAEFNCCATICGLTMPRGIAWGAFKRGLAASVPDLLEYG